MSSDELERVFEPFVRGSAAGGAAIGGTGLGLTIAKMLTDLMGGEMRVQSVVGQGTTFRIRLFLPEVRGAVAAKEIPRVARSGYVGQRRRILVVDNEEDDRGLLRSILQPLGFELSEAVSGEACLALLRQERFDAVFMDLAMPGLDGWQTIARIRAEKVSDAPIAIVSANAFDKGLDNPLGLAASHFTVKPVRVAELLDWLGARLQLQWLAAPRLSEAPRTDAPLVYPPPPQLHALQELVDLGYFRGICAKLDELEAADAALVRFAAQMRSLAREFQFETMTLMLKKALDEPAV